MVVLGVGNVLSGDDGVGVSAARELQRSGPPAGAQVYDLGTALWDLPSEADGCDELIVVDAVRSGGEPGSVYRAEIEGLEEAEGAPPLSLHQVGVRQMLVMARLSGLSWGRAVLIGVEVEDVSARSGLSASLRGALPRVVEAVKSEIRAARRPPEEVRT